MDSRQAARISIRGKRFPVSVGSGFNCPLTKPFKRGGSGYWQEKPKTSDAGQLVKLLATIIFGYNTLRAAWCWCIALMNRQSDGDVISFIMSSRSDSVRWKKRLASVRCDTHVLS